MNTSGIEASLKQLLSEKRFAHSKNVEAEAVKLAEHFGLNREKIRIAALAHDCVKNFTDEELINLAKKYGIKVDKIQESLPFLLHGPVGAFYTKFEFGIEDEEIFNAIYYHTTGRPNMTLFEQVIFLADMISIDRKYPEVDFIRELAYKDFDMALIEATNSTLKFVIERNFLIHPLTINFRNWLLTKGGK